MTLSEKIFPIYRISFMYYMVIGVGVVFSVGTVVSYLLGATQLEDMEPELFVPPIKSYIEKRQKKRNPVGKEGIAMLNGRGREKY